MMNNMNNLGMNPIGINNIGMRMNNQINLMNMNQNIQNIIQSYEYRIRELEELIKQKDIEIASLQMKLNNKINTFDNLMGNMMQYSDQNKFCISININANIKCPLNAQASIIRDILNKGLISFNHKPISPSNTLQENGIKDGSVINIIDRFYNLNFIDRGQHCCIVLDSDCSIKQAIKYFLEKKGIKGIYQEISKGKISFSYNNTILNIQDETPIKNVFKNITNHKILVIGGGFIDLFGNN